MTTIKVAAVQISPVLYGREGAVEKVVEKIIELGRLGVQFATFSETVVPYYPYFSFVQRPFQMGAEHLRLIEQAVTVPSVSTHAIAEASRQTGMVVSIGVKERDGDVCAEQTQVNIREHVLESGCFVVNATAWLSADQQAPASKSIEGRSPYGRSPNSAIRAAHSYLQKVQTT
jgi:predicted amidohydrolase